MLAIDNFLDILDSLLNIKEELLPTADFGDQFLEQSLDVQSLLPDSFLDQLDDLDDDEKEDWGLDTVGSVIGRLLDVLKIATVFIGQDVAQSSFVAHRFDQLPFPERVDQLKLQNFIFLGSISNIQLQKIVTFFEIKEQRDCIVIRLKFGNLKLGARRILLREGIGCTPTFSIWQRTHLRKQPDMNSFKPIRQKSNNGDLVIDNPANRIPSPGVNDSLLDQAIQSLFSPWEAGTKAVLVAHKGKIIREVYNNSNFPAPSPPPAFPTDTVGPFTPLLGWSMGKSVTNAMLGAMIQSGWFKVAYQGRQYDYQDFYKLLDNGTLSDGEIVREYLKLVNPHDYLPFLSTPKKGTFRVFNLNDLLQMTGGFKWRENKLPFDAIQMICMEKDMARFAGKKKLIEEPGTKWLYSSGTSNIITAMMKACFEKEGQFRNKKEALEAYWRFSHEMLFHPLGMRNTTFQTDIEGNFVGSSYCLASARDWARLGLLFLKNGILGDRKFSILPEGWVEYSSMLAGNPGLDPSKGRYGAHVWLNKAKEKDLDDTKRETGYLGVPDDMFYFRGLFGQRTFIIPSKDLVVVRLGVNDKLPIKRFLKDVVAAF